MTAILGWVPAYKNQLTGTTLLTTHALATMLRNRGINWGISSISNPDIEWVRNWAITHWFDCLPQYSHILMIDDDMGFMPDVVMDMLAFGEPVVGALYPKKTQTRQWAVSGVPTPEIRGPFLEVEGLGCGCFLIRRDAVATMIEKMPEVVDTRPHSLDSDLFREAGAKRLLRLFDKIQDPDRGTVSEDLSFCRRWRECGGKVWAATHHKMVHVGPYEFADTYAVWAEEEKRKRGVELAARLEAAPILKENTVLRGKACKRGLFVYNPNDTHIGRSLEAYGEWCDFEIDTLQKLVKDCDTVFDIGANIGTHTVPLSRMVGKNGHVFAFEAQPRLEKILEANIRLNDCGNVVWDARVIGDRDCQIALPDLPPDDVPFNFGASSLLGETNPANTVSMLAIDTFAIDENPRLIKIDVEGMEAAVIYGAAKTIERCKPVLYIDYGQVEETGALPELADALEAIDYDAFWSLGPLWNPMNAFNNGTNIWQKAIMSANLLAFPKGQAPFEVTRDLPAYLGAEDTWRKAIERMIKRDQETRAQAAE